MPTTATLLTFSLAALAVVVVPGPSIVYVVTRGLQHGRGAGLVSVAGLELGSLAHLVATVCGLAALLAATPGALDVLRWAGVGYLVWLGLRELTQRTGAAPDTPAAAACPTRLQLLRDGMLIDLLNPGTALFFLAFLPQFVDPAGHVAGQVLVLGGCYLLLAIVNDTAYAVVAGRWGHRLSGAVLGGRRMAVVTGLVYLGLAGLALTL